MDGISGIIGLGPPKSSTLLSLIGDSTGDPFISNVFAQNSSIPNFISFILQRSESISQAPTAKFTIGEYITGQEAIADQPKNAVQLLPASSNSSRQHWSIQIDDIRGPDNQSIPFQSTIPHPNINNKPVAVLDSGNSFSQVPSAITDAFYGRVNGASFDYVENMWSVPCDQELNVSFVIAGVIYPLHSLDLALLEN